MSVSPATRPWRWLDTLVLAGLLAVSLTLAIRCARSMSETIDEKGQMFLGPRVLLPGGFEGLTTWGTAPLPVFATATLPNAVAGSATEEPGDDLAFLFRRRMFNLCLFGAPLLIVLFVALREQSGLLAAASGTSLLAFSPMFLAHSVIAATDVCAMFFILFGLLATLHCARAPSWRNALLAGAMIGIAMAAKQTAVVLFGVAAIALWSARTRLASANEKRSRLEPWRSLALRLGAMVALAVVVTWAFYGFHLTTLSGDGPWRPHFSWADQSWRGQLIKRVGQTWLFPASWVSFVVQMVHNHGGHDTFFLGEIRRFGTWKYWPITLGLKGTWPEFLALALLGLRLVTTKFWRDVRTSLPLLTLLLLVAGCVSSKLNIGLRYLLPAAPLALLVLFGALDTVPAWLRRGLLVLGPVLGLAQCAIAFRASPAQLSYFNGFVIPNARVHRITADANLDWGQGLPSLKAAIARHDMKRVTLCTWGYLKPELYGIECLSWWKASPEQMAGSDWIAISASVLHDPRCELGRALTWIEPDDFGDLSLMLYSTRRPEVRQAFDQALAQFAAAPR